MLLAGMVAACTLVLALGAGSASALSCTTAASTVTVTLGGGESVTLRVGPGDAISANGASCGGTVATVDAIVVFGTDAGGETVTIAHGGGRFEPGATATDEFGFNEIEFFLSLGDSSGDSDMLVVDDSEMTGSVVIGEGGPFSTYGGVAPVVTPPAGLPFTPTTDGNLVNMNAFPDFLFPPGDADADVVDSGATGESVERIAVFGNGGSDNLVALGGWGTGQPTGQLCLGLDDESPSIALDGGTGDDFLMGGECGDLLVDRAGVSFLRGRGGNDLLIDGAGSGFMQGDDGDDTLKGGGGADNLMGEIGNDRLIGGAGNDVLDGGLGSDGLIGNDGDDTFLSRDGELDSIKGGAGIDSAELDAGLDRTTTLEILLP